jgi:hypothetical protein
MVDDELPPPRIPPMMILLEQLLPKLMPKPPTEADDERRLWDEVVRMRLATQSMGGTFPSVETAAEDANKMIAERRKAFPSRERS